MILIFPVVFERLLHIELPVHLSLAIRAVFLSPALHSVLFSTVFAEVKLTDVTCELSPVVSLLLDPSPLPAAVRAVPSSWPARELSAAGAADPIVVYCHGSLSANLNSLKVEAVVAVVVKVEALDSVVVAVLAIVLICDVVA